MQTLILFTNIFQRCHYKSHRTFHDQLFLIYSLFGSFILSSPLFTLDGIYVTGFVKNDPNHTKSKIHFIAEHLTFTLRSTKHMAIDGQVCFHIQPFAIPIKPPRCTTGSLGPVNHINKDVSGARLLPMTVLTYPVD